MPPPRTPAPRQSPRRALLAASGPGLPILLILLIVLAAPFVVHSVLRGLSVSDPAEIAASRFVSSDRAATLAIYGHMVTGGLLTGLAPLQLWAAPRRRWPALHRANGRLVAGLAIVTALAGLVYLLRQGSIGGWPMSAGFGLYGLLLLGTAVQTWRLARRRDPRHPAWAGRLVILAIASWLFRVQYGLWDIAFGAWGRAADFSGGFDRAMTVGFYLPWLILYEAVRALRSPRRRHPDGDGLP